MRTALVFGASGQLGVPLVSRLRGAGWRVVALSRQPRDDQPGLHWLRGDFASVTGAPRHVDAIFSCGPLDLFAQWYARAGVDCGRVVAFGSTSAETKRASADAAERALAARLQAAEAGVLAAAAERGALATLLRPTLVYGAGRDRSLTRIAQLARRLGRCVLPRGATGLRQPVHVDDLADAAWAACGVPATAGRSYALPGGERLPYREMVARVLAVLDPPPPLLEVPGPLFTAALLAARMAGRVGDVGDAAVARLRSDLVFDPGPARRDFGYAPRAFHPRADMFPA